MKSALITGINGQDGSYLAEHLLEEGYSVHGVVKRNSISENQTARIQHIFPHIRDNLYYGDLLDFPSLARAIDISKPDEIYNLAAQSHVRISFDEPVYTLDSIAKGTLNLLEAVRILSPETRFYQASSSEMFGNSVDDDGYQRETTRMTPVSPYACAKLCAFNLVKCYRDSYNIFASNGILFNHESPRRGENFVTNKVVIGAVKIKKGIQDNLALGNLDATRDWGHAKDYSRIMFEIMQLSEPDDYVCATGKSHSIRDLCEYTFKRLEMDYKDYVVQDERYFRPNELHDLKGDTSKIKSSMNFNLEYTFETMLDEMIDYWMDRL
jgi:GDPmannose 4,6-dehydratase